MSQYDFLNPVPRSFIIKARIVAVLLIGSLIAIAMFAGCAEREAPPTIGEQLDGFWKGGAWNHPDNRYYFHDGAMWTEKWVNGTLIDRQDYHYSIKGDRLNILDVATFERRDYRVEFPTDSTAWLEALPLGVDISLKRL